MIVMIDNYDSFTYNLVQYFGILGAEVKVFRNDRITVDEVVKLNPSAVVISPGPGDPTEAGISVETIRALAGKTPILGVCLGHQSMGYAFGADIIRAKKLMHGKVSSVGHDGRTIYQGIENPFAATRYHSLAIKKETLSPRFRINSWTLDDGEIMGIADDEARMWGIQYHPESILTERGMEILKNFLGLIG
jgi:anthranilate synthase/aminodeoxychorismate synthase-like glutamine amidotransferase